MALRLRLFIVPKEGRIFENCRRRRTELFPDSSLNCAKIPDMNRLIYFPVFACVLSLLIWSCGPGTTNPNPDGNALQDSAKAPGPGDNRGTRPWAADKNMLDPNLLQQIPDPLDESLLPFSPAFLQAKKVTSLEIRSYADTDNMNLSEDVAEQDMRLSRRRVFMFTPTGQMKDLLDERFMGDPTPATSMHVGWTYLPNGQPASMDFEEKLGSTKKSHQRKFTVDAQGQLISSEDKTSLSAYYGYDKDRGHVYMLRRPAQGASEVYVIGKQGDFPDTTCFRIQEEILMRESPFVNYAQTGPKLMDVIFIERKDRAIVREVHMGKAEEIDHTVDRQYDVEGNIADRRYLWDVADADFKTFTKYRYSPMADLVEVLHQRQSFNKPIVNEIDHYTYGPDGFLQKHVRTTRTGQEKEELILVEYYKVTQAAGNSTSGSAMPGGTQ
jgi:hypothetical protein